MLRLTTEDLSRALAGLTTTDKAELLRLLSERERLQQDEVFEDPREPLAEFVARTLGREVLTQSVARPVSWPPGEQPNIATFIASFAPVAPPTPPKAEPAVVSSVPDVPLRVPAGRRPRLLADVIEATQQEETRRQRERSDDDLLALYRRGPVDLDGGEYSDE